MDNKIFKEKCFSQNTLCKKWIKTKNPENKQNYIKYKKIFKALANQAQSDYYKQLFDTRVNSIKQLWANLNNFCSLKPKSRKTDISKLNINGNEITNKVDICNALNTCFCNIGQDLVNKLQQTNKNNHTNNFAD